MRYDEYNLPILVNLWGKLTLQIAAVIWKCCSWQIITCIEVFSFAKGNTAGSAGYALIGTHGPVFGAAGAFIDTALFDFPARMFTIFKRRLSKAYACN